MTGLTLAAPYTGTLNGMTGRKTLALAATVLALVGAGATVATGPAAAQTAVLD